MIERDRTGLWCEGCREAHSVIRGADPPCEQCWPGIDEGNTDAWEIYQMGITTPEGILAVSEKSGMKDPLECLFKITNLTGYLRALKGTPAEPMTEEDNG
jgi:hypothetical protein